jgi:tetratricopeptide (TPR) repeat protein
MASDLTNNNPELEALFRKYESAPDSYVFAPLADAYRKAGKLDEAVAICRKGLGKHPEYPSGHVVEGKCHFDVGMLDEAEKSFGKVLELDANNLVALKFLGMIQAGRGRLVEAGEYFKHILVLDPENREIKGMLDDIREVEQPTAADGPDDTGDLRGASDDDGSFEGEKIEMGSGDELSDDLATTTLADIYAAQGFVQKAARIYREVLRDQPGNEAVQRKLNALGRDGETAGEDHSENSPPNDLIKPKLLPEGSGSPDDDNVEPKEVVDEKVAVEDFEPAEPQDRLESDIPELFVTGVTGSDAIKLDEQKSYDQFKRWLENMNK